MACHVWCWSKYMILSTQSHKIGIHALLICGSIAALPTCITCWVNWYRRRQHFAYTYNDYQHSYDQHNVYMMLFIAGYVKSNNFQNQRLLINIATSSKKLPSACESIPSTSGRNLILYCHMIYGYWVIAKRTYWLL